MPEDGELPDDTPQQSKRGEFEQDGHHKPFRFPANPSLNAEQCDNCTLLPRVASLMVGTGCTQADLDTTHICR